MQDSRISNVDEISGYGRNALSGSTIISDNSESLTVYINGENTDSDAHYIYCNASSICNIDCQHSNACRNLNLKCFGSCYVNCDEINGNNCPQSGNYTIGWTHYPTMMPTLPTPEPSNQPTQPTIDPTQPTVQPTMNPIIETVTDEPTTQIGSNESTDTNDDDDDDDDDSDDDDDDNSSDDTKLVAIVNVPLIVVITVYGLCHGWDIC